MTHRRDLDVQEIVTRLCRMPVEFYAGSKSMIELLAESGVDRCPAALTIPYLSAYIADHPEVVKRWLRWSHKPYTNTWLFERAESGFVIRYVPNGEQLEIADPAVACAEFLVREVKDMIAHNPRLERMRAKFARSSRLS